MHVVHKIFNCTVINYITKTFFHWLYFIRVTMYCAIPNVYMLRVLKGIFQFDGFTIFCHNKVIHSSIVRCMAFGVLFQTFSLTISHSGTCVDRHLK